MGCCNNKKDCANKLPAEAPKEAFGDILSAVITGLTDVVKTGQLPTLFKNPAADALAVMLANLVAENRYLRELIISAQPDVAVKDSALKLSFGPDNKYTLSVPVTTENDRTALIARLQTAITQLKTPEENELNKQLELFERLK